MRAKWVKIKITREGVQHCRAVISPAKWPPEPPNTQNHPQAPQNRLLACRCHFVVLMAALHHLSHYSWLKSNCKRNSKIAMFNLQQYTLKSFVWSETNEISLVLILKTVYLHFWFLSTNGTIAYFLLLRNNVDLIWDKHLVLI